MANFKVLSAQVQEMLTDIRAGKGTLGTGVGQNLCVHLPIGVS
jgi:hypothetical protein